MLAHRFWQATLKIALVAVSLLVALLVAELGLRVFLPQNLTGAWREITPQGYFVNKSAGTARHQLCERVVSYEFSAPHLRGPTADESGMRILAVGDSMTFGWLLPRRETFVARLEQMLREYSKESDYRILNAAVAGWGAAQYVRYVEDFGVGLKPDVLLVFLSTDDIERSVKSGLYTLLPNGELRSDTGPARGRWRNAITRTSGLSWSLEHSHLLQFARLALVQRTMQNACASVESWGTITRPAVPSSPDSDTPPELAIAYGQALFKRLAAWSKQHDVKLLVTTNGWFRYKDMNPVEPTNAFIHEAPAFFAGLGVPYNDPSDKLAMHKWRDIVIIGDGHPDSEGARVIAEAVWPWLRDSLATQ